MRFFDCVFPRARTALCAIVTVAALAAAGCGPDFPKAYPVSGTVLLPNGNPLQGGKVEFESLTDAEYRGMGDLEKDGTFARVYTYKSSGREVPGLIAGEHRVRIEVPIRDEEDGGGARDPGEDPFPGARAAAKRRPPEVEPKYRGFDTSGLRITIPAPDNRVTIQLGKPGT